MNDLNYFLTIIFFTALSFCLTFYSLKLMFPRFCNYLPDKPNSRSSHKITKPTGGGITFVVSITLISLFFQNLLPLLCLPISLVGFLDDRFNLPAIYRYLVQFATASVLVTTLPLSLKLFNLFHPIVGSLLIIFLIIAATGIINFINFMDGLDGLITGCLLLIFLTYAILYEIDMLIIVGSLLAFLLWNWEPAKIFMGDAGSTFLGSLYIGLILKSNLYTNSFSILVIGTPILIDPLLCVLRRLFDSQNIFTPHKLHLYQRLNQSGWRHSKVALCYLLMTLILCLALIFGGLKNAIFLALLELIIGFYLDKKIAKPFKYVNK